MSQKPVSVLWVEIILSHCISSFCHHFHSVRKILAPGEEENLELEEEEDAAAGGGSTEAFPPRAPGTTPPSITVNQTRPHCWGRLICCVMLSCLWRAVWLCVFLFSLSVLCMASSLIPACFMCSFARYGLITKRRLNLFSAAGHTLFLSRPFRGNTQPFAEWRKMRMKVYFWN